MPNSSVNKGNKISVYYRNEDLDLIQKYAKKHKLTLSKAVIQLSLAGFENQGEKTSTTEKLQQQIDELREENQKHQAEIDRLTKKLERITEMMATSRLDDIRDNFIWEEDNPPRQQIPIHLWYDASNPNYKEYEKYGLTQRQLLYKMFGLDGERLFQRWCAHLDINKERDKEKRIDYLKNISGAERELVKLPGQSKKTNRYTINYLFDEDYSYLFEEE